MGQFKIMNKDLKKLLQNVETAIMNENKDHIVITIVLDNAEDVKRFQHNYTKAQKLLTK